MRRIGHIRERTPGAWEVRYSLCSNPATGAAMELPPYAGPARECLCGPFGEFRGRGSLPMQMQLC